MAHPGGMIVAQALAPRPEWLKIRFVQGENFKHLKHLMRDLQLHTVCEEARCPNIYECWEHRAATFMILGEICTRRCAYCAVTTGRPVGLDWGEPDRVAQAVAHMGLRHAVVTSVNRDDQPDGGAAIFAATIRRIRARTSECTVECTVEVLIPDLMGVWWALELVLAAEPEILNHNIETVPRVFPRVRPRGSYERSLDLLSRAGEHPAAQAGRMLTKSGLIVGMGERREEISGVLRDLRAAGVSVVTVGQYLRPTLTARHIPVERFYAPDEFADIRAEALALGFRHAECGPLVRSSYHAWSQARQAREATGTHTCMVGPEGEVTR
ncbi:MAG: lipoyl synthase [Chloroflexi bacterium]|nr:lipoyl synthase [Chloroflexota bacterium]